jgi:hypothetical protein
VIETSRLNATAHALGLALEALADALAHADGAAIAASERSLDVRTEEFRAAAAAAVAAGEPLAPTATVIMTTALSRCRRLGFSLSLLAGPTAPTPDAPHGYTPVGRPLSAADGGTFLTARG